MRVAVVTGGSRGDVQPYVALASELRRRGHDVVVVSYVPNREAIEDLGLTFVALSGDPQWIVEELNDAGQTVVRYASRFRHVTERLLGRNFAETLEGCEGADAVVYASVAFLGFFAARELGVPALMAEMQPVLQPTARYPSAVVPPGPRLFGTLYNRLSYAVVRQIYWQTFRSMFGEIEARVSRSERVPPLRGPWKQLRKSGLPILCGWSPRVVPRPPDWQERGRVTGYWFLNEARWAPPDALDQALSDDQLTVAVGFSSVRALDAVGSALERISQAARGFGARVIFVRGWSGLAYPDSGGPSAVTVREAPHDWLLPRVNAVVHHGGAGTTAAALRAGVPAIIIPFSADQAFWGRAVERAGAGVLCQEVTRRCIERAFREVTGERLRAGAARLGREIRAERGVTAAAEIIEHSVGS